jgi:hypothetical protein
MEFEYPYQRQVSHPGRASRFERLWVPSPILPKGQVVTRLCAFAALQQKHSHRKWFSVQHVQLPSI